MTGSTGGHQGCIDVHSHLFPIGLPDFAERFGERHWPTLVQQDRGTAVIVQDGEVYRRIDASYWDVEPRLSWMDKAGIGRQVVSPLPVLLTYWAGASSAHEFAMHLNESIAEFVSQAPDRLIGFGTVPLQYPQLAIKTLEEIKRLGLGGVEIGSHAGGLEFDRPELRPFFEAAAELGVPLFLHALEADGLGRVDNRLVRFGVGVPADTGLTAAFLLLSGVLADLPELRLCLGHGGGSFFWSLPRIGKLLRAERGADAAQRLVDAITSVYVDTAGLDGSNVDFLLGHLAPNRIVIGSDFPAAKATPPLDCLAGAGLDDRVRKEITSVNSGTFLGFSS